jgi:hypothetical protein
MNPPDIFSTDTTASTEATPAAPAAPAAPAVMAYAPKPKPGTGLLEKVVGGDSTFNTAAPQYLPPTDKEQWTKQQILEAKTTGMDRFWATIRQDGMTANASRYIAMRFSEDGSVDPSWNPHYPTVWENLVRDIPKEYHHEFFDTFSAKHATFVREGILQKMADLETLSTANGLGQAALRMGMQVFQPENALVAALPGAIPFRVARGSTLAGELKGALAAGNTAKAAEAAGSLTKMAPAGAGDFGKAISYGAVENAALEYGRQQFNFEDDKTAVAINGLLGMLLSAPASLYEARMMGRGQALARQELSMLNKKDMLEKEIARMENPAAAATTGAAPAAAKVDAAASKGGNDMFTADELAGSMDAEFMDAQRAGVLRALEKAEKYLDQMPPAARDDIRLLRKTIEELPDDAGSALEALTKFMQKSPDNPVSATVHSLKDKLEKRAAESAAVKAAAKDRVDATDFVTGARPAADIVSLHPSKADAPWKKDDPTADALGAEGTPSPHEGGPIAYHNHEGAYGLKEDADGAPIVEGGYRLETYTVPGENVQRQRLVKTDVSEGAIPEPPKEGAAPDPVIYFARNSKGDFVAIELEAGMKIPTGTGAEAQAAKKALFQRALDNINEGIATANGTRMSKEDGVFLHGLRFDTSAVLHRSKNSKLKELVSELVHETIGFRSGTPQRATVEELKDSMVNSLKGQFMTEARAGYSAWVAANKKSFWARVKDKDFDNYLDLITRATRKEQGLFDNMSEEAVAAVQRGSKAQQRMFSDALDLMQAHGVEGADKFSHSSTYVNRMHNHGAISAMAKQHGDTAVVKLVSKAIVWAPPAVKAEEGATARQIAKAARQTERDRDLAAAAYLKAVRTMQLRRINPDLIERATDAEILRGDLLSLGLNHQEATQMIEAIFDIAEAKPGQVAGNLKMRFKLDETTAMLAPDGVTRLHISQLFENNAAVLADHYLNSTMGHTAFARKGFKSSKDWDKRVREINDEHAANPTHSTEELEKEMRLLDDTRSAILGRPRSTDTFSSTDRVARNLRTYGRAAFLGQLGLPALVEAHKALALTSFEVMRKQLPALMSIIRAVRAGAVPDNELSKAIRVQWGHGTERMQQHSRMTEAEYLDFGSGRMLAQAENLNNTVAQAVDIVSGNAHVTSMTRELSARAWLQQMSDWADTGGKLTAEQYKRFVGLGMTEAETDAVLAAFKKHSNRDDGGVLDSIRYEDFQAAHPEMYDLFHTAVDRQVRDMIQKQSLGEIPPFMHSTLGKVFGELRNFVLAGHAKTTLKALHYRDGTSMAQLMYGMVFETLAYTAQTALNFAGDKEEREKRLQPQTIAMAVFQRMSLLGMAPFVAGTGARFVGLEMPGLSANTENRDLLVPPSVKVMQNAFQGMLAMGQTINPNMSTSSKEFSAGWKAVPFGNTWGMRSLGNHFASELSSGN